MPHYLNFSHSYLDDDPEDLIVVSDSGNREVCYGRLDNSKVHAHQVPTPSQKSLMFNMGSQWPVIKLALQRLPGKDNVIRVLDPQGKDFGTVDVRTAMGLARIMDSRVPKFRTQAKLQPRKRRQNEYPSQPCSEYFDMVVK